MTIFLCFSYPLLCNQQPQNLATKTTAILLSYDSVHLEFWMGSARWSFCFIWHQLGSLTGLNLAVSLAKAGVSKASSRLSPLISLQQSDETSYMTARPSLGSYTSLLSPFITQNRSQSQCRFKWRGNISTSCWGERDSDKVTMQKSMWDRWYHCSCLWEHEWPHCTDRRVLC